MDQAQILQQKLEQRQATIGVVGLGYVGLPLLLRYSDAGYRVCGIDVDQAKVDQLNAGKSYISHIPACRIVAARKDGFKATTVAADANQCDALIICVPTPLDGHREPDLRFVVQTMDMLKPYLKAGQVISLESTTYPGTTEEILLPCLQGAGLVVGVDAFLVYSPEREDPGRKDFTTQSIPKVIGGYSEVCLRVGQALYEQSIDQIVPVSSTKTAEMVKLLENIHRAVNIGLVNEMKVVADRMGIDIHEVIDAASTKPFGFVPYYPGPGLGGHCIPIDPFYLTWKAREFGVNTRFIELAGEVNSAMPEYVLGKLVDGLNEQGKALKGSQVLILGVAYKKNVGDMRESPSARIMELIQAKGGQITYSDPYVPVFPQMRRHSFDLQSVDLNPDSIEAFDAVVLATDHDDFDYDQIEQNAQLIVDTRGRWREPKKNIIKA